MKVKTRFCPSPTGYMHLGNLRTALFSALFARSQNGDFLLRIEDTDLERSDEKYTQSLIEDLLWMGLGWQEGPGVEKGNGPYWQSQRQTIYDKYYKILEEEGFAYPCFCSEQQLAMVRKSQLAAGQPPRYRGTCLSLSQEEMAQKIASGEKPTLRFAIPKNTTIEFIDLVKGEQRFQADDIGDFIIRRADGTPSFMFCNAIDDALMGVTHVLRGEDHLTNTPRQLLISRALGLSEPRYGHLSLIGGMDGFKLSKRYGSSSIKELKANGVLAGALMNYLARLGHYYENNNYLNFNELSDLFKLENLSKSPAKFDENQLMYWQKIALGMVDENTLWNWMGELVREIVPKEFEELFIKVVRPNILFPQDALLWANIFFRDLTDFNEECLSVLREADAAFFECALSALENVGNDVPRLLEYLKEKLHLKGRGLFLPLRIALTGLEHGPELAGIFALLGENRVKERFKKVITIL